jgi:hypothetical protein
VSEAPAEQGAEAVGHRQSPVRAGIGADTGELASELEGEERVPTAHLVDAAEV